jgi:hypothetical protein
MMEHDLVASMSSAQRAGALIALVIGMVLVPIGLAARQAEASAQLSPDSAIVRSASGVLQAGQTITLPVEVLNVQNLGAVTVVVGYDWAVVAVAGCRRGAAFDAGLCNVAYDSDGDGQPDAVRFNLVSLTGVSTVGETPLNLANITWTSAERLSLAVTRVLTVQVQTFTDPDSFPMDVSTLNGQIIVKVPYLCWLPLVMNK